MPSPRLYCLIPIAAFACLTGCTSGGGGGGSAATILTAAFVGGSSPMAGDSLVLTVSRPVTPIAGASLDDDDFVLSSGTLGAIVAAPQLVSEQTISITLGAGVTFQPGTTTIVFSDRQDALRGTDGSLARGGSPRTITRGDGDEPRIEFVTVDAVASELNGSGPAGGLMQVPRRGFTIDVEFSDATSPILTSGLFVTSTFAVQVGAELRQPGDDLSDALMVLAAGPTSASLLVPTNVTFQDGEQDLTVIVTDVTGMSSKPKSFELRVQFADDAVRPFELGQLWYLDTSRDVETIGIDLSITETPNGNPDLEDVFVAVGLHSGSELPTNDTVMQIVQTRILAQLASLFDGTPVTFTFTSPGAFPANQSSVPYQSFGFSQICIAGSATGDASQILGSALFDRNNAEHEDNCLTDFGASNTRLGVFPHASLVVGFASGPTSTFRITYDPFTPFRAGTPIGDFAGDASRLAEVAAGTNMAADPRITRMDTAIERMARLLAVVTAHECGHSMGLVANGPMPNGLYGNDPVNFPMSGGLPPSAANGHIQNTSLYPPGAQNVMSPAINFDAAQSVDTVFNSLNLAYLRERVIYVPN